MERGFEGCAWGVMIASLALSACQPDDPVELQASYDHWPYEYHDYEDPQLPPQLDLGGAFDNMPATNPVTNAGARLGRVLFYDKALSRNFTTSCGSCHHQSIGFADAGVGSVGFLGEVTDRNSMGLVNLRFIAQDKWFWDERMTPLESQVLGPIQNLVEMGMLLSQMRARVDSIPYYDDLFFNAFGDTQVTNQRVARALAQFLRSMVSTASRYDEAYPTYQSLTSQEDQGRQLFDSHCASCHVPPHFVVDEPRNNGLSLDPGDTGHGFITNLPEDMGTFRPPSLRNVALTAPYMHDGRFTSLDQVLEHYSSGIQDHPNLGAELRDQQSGLPVQMNFTVLEKQALIVFLGTLTDHDFLTDPKWSDPFE